MQKGMAVCWLLLLAATLTNVRPGEALPYRLVIDGRRINWNPYSLDYPDQTQELLEKLENLGYIAQQHEQQQQEDKRSLDLGLSRGYSGSQAAKHLMGLAAANFAGGPGRRRRSPMA